MLVSSDESNTDYYRLDDLLSADEKAVRDRVRAFSETEIVPVINDYWERAIFPAELIPKLRTLGLTGGSIRGYGCPGISRLAAALVIRELARGDGSLCAFFGSHCGLAMETIARLGSEEQRQRWLSPMARFEIIGAFALTEPDHGSDAVNLETLARRHKGHYVLQGVKRWVGNAPVADLIIVWARDDDGTVGGYLVPKDTHGLSVRVIAGKVALRASMQADVLLADVRVPMENRLPDARDFRDVARVLADTRVGVAWQALGHAMAAYEIALRHAARRHSFGKPLSAHQAIQARLAAMLVKVTSMQLVALRATQLQDAGTMTEGMASLAKLHNCTLAREVAADCRDLLGGNGLLLDNHVARHWADIEAILTYEGTSAIQALIIGKEITGVQAFG
jgi:glutaryl-CoA dehydrogenase